MRLICTLILLLISVTAANAEDTLTLAFSHTSLANLATLYSALTNKKITFADESIKGVQLSAFTGDTPISKDQAIKYLESAFYLKGIQVTPSEDGSLVLSRYAQFKDPTEAPKRIIRPQNVSP